MPTSVSNVAVGKRADARGSGYRAHARTRLRWGTYKPGSEFATLSDGSYSVATPAVPAGGGALVVEQYGTAWREVDRTPVLIPGGTPAPPPVAVISNLRAEPGSDPTTQLRVRWSVSQKSTGRVEYRKRGTTTWSVREPQQTTPDYTEHDQTITGLAPGTCYDVRVTSNGITAALVGDPMTCTQPTPLPSPPPPVPSPTTPNVTVALAGLQAAINAAPDGTALAPYVIKLSGGGTVSATVLIEGKRYLVIDEGGFTITAAGAPGVVFSGPGVTQEIMIIRASDGIEVRNWNHVGTHDNPGTYYTDGREFQSGITVSGSRNVWLHHGTTRDNMGDGIGVDAWGSTKSQNVRIDHVDIEGNGRMGITSVHADAVTAEDITGRNWAWAFLEVEPDSGGQVSNVTYRRITLEGEGLLFFALNIIGGNHHITVEDGHIAAGANRGAWSTLSEPRTGRNADLIFRRITGDQPFWEDPTGPGSGWPVRGVVLIKDADRVLVENVTQPVTPSTGMYGLVNNGSTAVTRNNNSFPNAVAQEYGF